MQAEVNAFKVELKVGSAGELREFVILNRVE